MKIITSPSKIAADLAELNIDFDVSRYHFDLYEYEKGELLVTPDRPMDRLMFIISGYVRIYNLLEDGTLQMMGASGSGSLMGELEMLSHYDKTTYGEALSRTQVLTLNIPVHKALIKKDPAFMWFLLEKIVQKNISESSLKTSISLKDKLLFYLKNVSADHRIESPSQLSVILNCSTRHLLRILDQMVEEGELIKEKRGHYHLP